MAWFVDMYVAEKMTSNISLAVETSIQPELIDHFPF